MEPLTWVTVAQLIVEVGLPMAQKIVGYIQSGAVVTDANWADAMATATLTGKDLLKAQLTAAKIPLDSEQAKALLALVS